VIPIDRTYRRFAHRPQTIAQRSAEQAEGSRKFP
jgi:hypothetical protein